MLKNFLLGTEIAIRVMSVIHLSNKTDGCIANVARKGINQFSCIINMYSCVEQTTPFNGEYLNSSLVEQLDQIQFVTGSIPVSKLCLKTLL